MTRTTALIDADVIAFRCVIAAQDDTDWGDGITEPTVDTAAAIKHAHGMVEKWRDWAEADDVVLCFSPRDGGNFRRKVLPGYKANRGPKPKAYWDVVDSLEDQWTSMYFPYLEADDVMGIMQTSDKTGDTIIVSIDKDMRTIPGRLLNPYDPDNDIETISELEADLAWMTQTITGDSTDGYKGCPGAGPVAASKALDGCRNLRQMWPAVLGVFWAKGLGSNQALVQARLARILRRDDYNSKKGIVYLWHPKKTRREPLVL